MKRVVWKNKSNGQLCVTIPKDASIREGEIVEVKNSRIQKIAYIGVVADLFHYGHLRAIQFANSVSDYMICGVFTDECAASYRAEPIANLQERKSVVSSLNCVDRVVIQHTRDPTENLRKIHDEFPEAEIILVHGDYLQHIPGEEYVKSIGGQVVRHPYYERLSYFKIVRKLLEQRDKFKDIIEFSSILLQKKDLHQELQDKTIVSSKANILQALKPILRKSVIEDFYVFTEVEWRENRAFILNTITQRFQDQKIIIRHSLIEEHFGYITPKNLFKSISNINGNDTSEIKKGVDQALSSYQNLSTDPSFHQIIIQRQNPEIGFYGSAFLSRTDSPYWVVQCEPGQEPAFLHLNQTYRLPSHNNKEAIRGLPIPLPNIGEALYELQDLDQTVALEVYFGVTRDLEVILFTVSPPTHTFVHGWGGRTSIPALECHTLRYVQFPERIGNAIDRSIYCEIRQRHHTVYFDQKDVERWNKEGARLLQAEERRKIINQNHEQIRRFYDFYDQHKDKNFAVETNVQLGEVYTQLMHLVMENGSFFPYSREETTVPLKEKTLELLKGAFAARNDFELKETLLLLLTPIQEDIFFREEQDKLNLIALKKMSDPDLWSYALRHPWRFINSFSRDSILNFLRQEFREVLQQDLAQKIALRKKEGESVRTRQEEMFANINNDSLRGLCYFLQEIAVLRLENKKIWAGYEFLFLSLWEEIASRLGLSVEEFLYSYRIEDTKRFLKEGIVLPREEVDRRLNYFNLEIFPHTTIVGYSPKYSRELRLEPSEKGLLMGEAGNTGLVRGRALIVTDDSINSLLRLKQEMTTEDIYITTMTHPAMVSLLHHAKGIITDEGGITSHAAIISRELGIPCLVGTRNATSLFKTGDLIELNAHDNYVKKLTASEIREHLARGDTFPAARSKVNNDGPRLSTYTEFDPVVIVPSSRSSSLPYLASFSEAESWIQPFLGGKGRTLVSVSRQHRVPDGICVTRRLFDELLASYLTEKKMTRLRIDSQHPEEAQNVLSDVRQFILDSPFPSAFEDELHHYLSKLGAEQVAVRSSASCEDSSRVSFAGQFATVLGVPPNRVNEALKKCLASVFQEHIISYALQQQISMADFFMAAVIQRFIPSEKAGVLFTVHPRDSHRQGFWIDANFGVGESVVSGSVKPDHYFIHEKGIDVQVAEEKEAYLYVLDGNLKKEHKQGQVLNMVEIDEIVQLGKKLREQYQTEIEYEWAIQDDAVHLLQVRPITARGGA